VQPVLPFGAYRQVGTSPARSRFGELAWTANAATGPSVELVETTAGNAATGPSVELVETTPGNAATGPSVELVETPAGNHGTLVEVVRLVESATI